jgi:hypothetical protein
MGDNKKESQARPVIYFNQEEAIRQPRVVVQTGI